MILNKIDYSEYEPSQYMTASVRGQFPYVHI